MHSICPVSLRTPNIIVAIFQLLLFSTLFLSSLPYWSPANVQAVGSPDFSIALSPSFAVYPQDMSQLSSSIILTSENGFNGVIDLNFYWYNGSSDIFISLVNPYLNSGRSVTETVKIFSPPLPSTGCCGILGVTGSSSSLSHSANLTIAVPSGPDFALSSDLPSITLAPGAHGQSSVTVTSIDSVGGRVFFPPATLQNSRFSGGWSFYLDEVWLVPGSRGSVMFQVYAAVDALPGSYVFKITGSSFSHSHSINLTVNVSPIVSGDFELTINPETLVMHPNTSINATMSLRGFDGFSGSVYLSAIEVSQCCPLPTTGDPFAPRAFARPSQIMLGINGFDNSNLTIETPNLPLHGNYTIEVFAQSGSIIHAFNLTVTVPPVQKLFTIESDPISIIAISGNSASSTLVIRSIYDYAGTVNLSTTVSSPGSIQARVGSEVVKLQPQVQNQYLIGSLAIANLTISSSSSTPSGTYTITVRGTAGAYMYTDHVIVKLASSGPSAQPSTSTSSSTRSNVLSLPITIFYGTIAALAISVAVAVGLLVWSSRGKKDPVDPSMTTI